MKRYIRYIGILLLLPLLAACAEDTLTTGADGPEGESAEITLSFSVPEQDRLSRANISDENAYRVNSVWVGIFNAGTGEMTNENKLIEYNSSPVSGFHGNGVTISGLSTKSGYSYIVMVANPDENEGIDINRPTEIKLLSELLAGVRTLDDYRCISAHISSIETPAVGTSNGLAMAGAYHSSATQDPASWETLEQVFIPMGKSTLQGAVHLRRLLSQIKFEITTGEDVEEFEPISYTVYNVPNYSWLQERAQTGTGLDYANAGDYLNSSEGLNNPSYPVSDIYRSTYFSKTGNTYSFDFWQFENKRTGIIPAADLAGATKEQAYAMRERQFNTDGNPIAVNTPDITETNSGIFMSLCDFNNGKGTLNNCATYVKINGRLTLTPEANPETGITPASKIANVTYIVHLGYVADDANNFESLRNSIYTYKMTVNGIHNIELEAHRTSNDQPGAAGVVSTVEEAIFECDAHAATFNIYLSQQELENFSFSMTSYFNNQPVRFSKRRLERADGTPEYIIDAPVFDETTRLYTYKGSTFDPAAANSSTNNLNEWMRYSWIELALVNSTAGANNTTARYTLLPYPGRHHKPSDTTNKLYRLNDIDGSLTPGWYTVYVHEYTDEWDADESGFIDGSPRWAAYVDQQARSAYLNVAEATSTDGESSIYTSKYAINQRSIQTYYNNAEGKFNSNGTALGLEKDNEAFGMNLIWNASTSGWNAENGRFNTWRGLGGSLTTTDSIGSAISNGWYNTSNVTVSGNGTNRRYTQMSVNAVNNRQQYTATAHRPNLLSPAVSLGSGLATDPQPTGTNNQRIEIIRACLNRNIDLNGDGHIDASEMKWYVPSRGNYLRMIIGRSSLEEPLMTYEMKYLEGSISGGENTRFHIATSDYYQIWLDEGLSSSILSRTQYPMPWDMRCVRNLGTNLNSFKTGIVEPAYTVSRATAGGGLVIVKSYYGTTLRNPRTSPFEPHYANEEENKMGRYGFEVARGDIDNANLSYNSDAAYITAITTGNLCSTLDTTTGRSGWRTPNQKELAIMLRGALIPGESSYYYFSSTREPYNWQATNGLYYLDQHSNNSRWATVCGTHATCRPVYGNYPLNRLRCVRDLTESEQSLTVDDLTYDNN